MQAEDTESALVVPRYWDPIEQTWMPARRVPASSDPGSPLPPPRPPQRPIWPLTVAGVTEVTPDVRRISLRGDGLDCFRHEPGADLVVYFPSEAGAPMRRHYTARRFDPVTRILDVDVVMHGNGPGIQWAASVQAGDRLDVSGPLVRRELDRTADWHLLAGDETAIPAILGLVEALPAGATALVFLEISGPAEQQPLFAQATVELRWVFRGNLPGHESRELADAIAAEPLPPGRGDAFLAGETGHMRDLRKALLDRGFEREGVFAMGYWRPGRVGGDETIKD